MKTMIWRLTSLAAFTALTLGSGLVQAQGAEDRAAPPERKGPPPSQAGQPPEPFMRQLGGRLERLEQRLDQMAERQEQWMRQTTGQRERMGAVAQPGPGNVNQPPPPLPGMRRPRPPEMAPPMAMHRKADGGIGGLLVIAYLICNVLMAIWIFTDIRKRGEGPAIFIALALIAGIPAALIYSVVRIGDKKAASP